MVIVNLGWIVEKKSRLSQLIRHPSISIGNGENEFIDSPPLTKPLGLFNKKKN